MTEDLIIHRKTIPAREPEYADFPEKLHPDIVKFLKNHGIEKLYIHQTEAYEQAAEGKNLVITTPTWPFIKSIAGINSIIFVFSLLFYL